MSIVIKLPNFAYWNILWSFKSLSVQDRDIVLYNYKNNTHIRRRYMDARCMQTKFNNTPFKNELVANYKKHHCIHMKLTTDKNYVKICHLQGALSAFSLCAIHETGILYSILIAILLAFPTEGMFNYVSLENKLFYRYKGYVLAAMILLIIAVTSQ